MLQRKHSQMVNLFVDSSLPSFPTSSFYRRVELPSNQTSNQHYASILPQEEKIIGTKRQQSFSFENTQIPPLVRYQCSPHLNSSSLSHSRSNIGLTHITSREAMVGISLDLNSKTSAAAGGNSITFASNSSTSSQNCQQEFSKFSPFSIQKESIEELQQRSGTSSSTHKTLFYSFLPTEHEQEDGAETTLSLNGRTFETKSDGIDLSLKL
ncbi:protein SPEAR4 isoform X2 [Carica papaya]|uniref:protein SPEAR4 isoform X2 n=1 Tax=Carica papaya TaxID=3649 RepID=UPI000B8CE9F2|nr:protein SPEAR4 isoform X2 [Carica papaya]